MGRKAKAAKTSAELKAAPLVPAAHYSMSAFEGGAGDYFAVVTPGVDAQRLKVWDTHSAAAVLEYAGAPDERFTSVAWGAAVEGERAMEAAQINANASAADPAHAAHLLALGHADGTITILSLSRGAVIKKLTGGHTAAVTDFVFTEDGTAGFSAGSDGTIVTWNLRTGAAEHKSKADENGIHKIAMLEDSPGKILSAGYSVKLYDIAADKEIQSFAGHSSAVTYLGVSSSQKFAITASESDRFISIHNLSSTSSFVSSLTMDCAPTCVSVSGMDQILAVTEEGTVNMWGNPCPSAAASSKKKKKYTTKPSDATLKFVDDKDVVIPVLKATFIKDGTVLVARGSVVRPVFERVDICDDDGALKSDQDLKMVRGDDKNILLKNQTTQNKSPATSVHVLGPADMTMPTTASGINKTEEMESTTAEPSLGEKLSLLSKEGALMTPSGMPVKPSASSLHTLLTQAIHSSDSALFEKCLSVTDKNVILNTVKRLPSQYVVPLVKQLTDRFISKPNKTNIIDWLKTALMVHVGYLMTVPDTVSHLASLHATIESRIALHGRMNKLSGRLDMVLNQIQVGKLNKEHEEREEEPQAGVWDEEAVENAMDEDTESHEEFEEFNEEDFDLDSDEESDDADMSVDEDEI